MLTGYAKICSFIHSQNIEAYILGQHNMALFNDVFLLFPI